MNDLTVIYYTAQRENPVLEERVKATLLATIGDIPLISVSQKPIDFGYNICVGDVGYSSQNAWRQFQLGAIEAKTRFVCPAESDFLYPREYFDFRAEREDIFYVAHPVYVLFAQRRHRRYFSLKPWGSEGAIIVGREHLIKNIDRIFEGHGMWRQELESRRITPLLFNLHRDRINFKLDKPIITFKTDNNMHRISKHDSETDTRELPHWGHVDTVIRDYLV